MVSLVDMVRLDWRGLTDCRALKWAGMTDHRVGRNRADVSDDINEDYSDQ
jgi:hypothetical protein